MTPLSKHRTSVCLLALLSTPAIAQDSEEAVVTEGNAIVVTGERLRGQLDVEQAPVLELNTEDIEAIGATSIEELIEAISPQTGSARGRNSGGRPVFLVNGIRIGSFRELRSYPPEAIEKVEVMPEEVAQKFGYPPDRRVVNLILKDNYASREVEFEFKQPWEGGFNRNEQEFTLLTINDGARLNLNVEREARTMLTEAERNILYEDGEVPAGLTEEEFGAARSLISEFTQWEGTANWAKAIASTGGSLSLNLTAETNKTRSLSGVQDFATLEPLERITNTDTYSFGGSYSQSLGRFQITTTSDASLTDTSTRRDRSGDTGYDLSKSRQWSANAKTTARGGLFYLPAGEFATTFDVGYSWDRIVSSDTRSAYETELTRGDVEAGVNVVVPITSRRDQVWDAIGTISLSGQAGVNHLSDFGTLYDWSMGLNWSPWDNLDLQATYIWREVAPSLSQLGSPITETLNVSTYDFVNGESVLATVISGGNPDLQAETQRDWKFSANWELPFWENTRLSAEYIRNRSSNVTSSLPAITAAIESAFADRITRDATGRLVAIDSRPVTYARTRADRLVFGLTTRGSFGEARPQEPEPAAAPQQASPASRGGEGRRGGPSPEQRAAFMQFREKLCADDGLAMLQRLAQAVVNGEDLSEQFPGFDPERAARMVERMKGEDGAIDQARLAQFRERICSMDPAAMGGRQAGAGGPPSGGNAQRGGGRRGGPGFGRPGGDGRGRYFINLTHTIELDNRVLIAAGVPELDLLDGDASGSTGTARHGARLEAGAFRNGKGIRLSGTYTGKARINGSDTLGSGDLFFGDLATFDIRMFADLGRILEKEEGFLKNFRISLRMDNVFDARRKVTDQTGEVPIGYQPYLIDPVGRYVGVDLRKLF